MAQTKQSIRNEWNKQNYTRIVVSVDKSTAEQFKNQCIEKNISQSSILKNAIYKFLGDQNNDKTD